MTWWPASSPARSTPWSRTRGHAGDGLRADLAEVVERHAVGHDEARPAAVAKRRKTGQRTARENVEDLLDPGSFVEYGPLAIAAQRRRRPLDDLIANTPADGLVAGIGTVAGQPVAVLSYDYTVLAGTQGLQNHRKKDRLFDVIERQRLPVVFFAEGGGGRPGDTDGTGRLRPRLPRVLAVGRAVGPGAARRHRVGPLLRRQRRHPRVLRRRHRHRGRRTSAWAARR